MSDTLLRSLFEAAVAAARPDVCLPSFLPKGVSGRVCVIGAGKAAASMARAVETSWQGPLSGLVVTRYDHGVDCDTIEVIEAAHPVPDAAGQAAADRIFSLVSNLGADDLLLCLISGGGSALLSLPAPGISLDDKRAVNSALLKSGATISEMNCVRKHLSAIKGGRLAQAAQPARVLTLAISDVPGDDPAVIASGPTVPDPTTYADVRAVIDKYGIDLPPSVAARIAAGADETPKPGDACFENVETTLIARPMQSLQAAAKLVRDAGYAVEILGDAIEGEARDVAAEHAALAMASKPGTVLLSGGETTVTVQGTGRGGRNAEYALALALALKGAPGISAIACDTDGIDGTEDNAGCIVRPDTLSRAITKGLDAPARLANNDAYGFFDVLGDLVITGPTRTNVNDFRAIVIKQ